MARVFGQQRSQVVLLVLPLVLTASKSEERGQFYLPPVIALFLCKINTCD